MKIDLFGDIIQEEQEESIKAPRTSPWDYIKSIAKKTPADMRDYHKEWFYVNKAYSMHQQTALYANEMNKYHNLPPQAQYDFYYHGLPKKNFFAKWAKMDKSEFTEMVAAYFDVSFKVAKQYERVLTQKQFEQIRDWYRSKEGGKGK